MPLRVSEVRMPLHGDEKSVVARALERAGLDPDEVASVELVRKSLDRRRRYPELVYTFDFHLKDAVRAAALRSDPRVAVIEEAPSEPLPRGDRPLDHRPVVIGAGPAGLFAALVLARHGYRPLLLERGARMNERVRHVEAFHRGRELLPESNYLFGEGGAGTFSDGKLTCRSKDPRGRFVLDEFRTKSGIESIRYYYRPHLGSDRVRAVVGHLRREIESLGGELRYGARVEGLRHALGRMQAVRTPAGEIGAQCVICAPGHSARDFYEALQRDGVTLEQKAFQMGFRVEHPQAMVNDRVYCGMGDPATLGPADYRLSATIDGRSVFSFCMCPGGEIMPSVHDALHFSTNGMSYFHKDTGFATSGLVTTIEPAEFGGAGALAGIELQAHYERLAAVAAGPRFALPAQRLADFAQGRLSRDVPRTSSRSGEVPADLAAFAPAWLVRIVRRALPVFERQMRGFLGPEGVIGGPEARSSSPVRIVRDPETLVAAGIDGLYPVGEGAGYAGGIVSAAIDGVRAAEAVIRRFAPAASGRMIS
jgi:uncharacterized protein